MRTTKKHFNYFKKECQKWIDRFGLHGWKVYYAHVDTDCYARVNTSLTDRVATIQFTTDWSNENNVRPLTEKEIARTAKHEMIHLLLTTER